MITVAVLINAQPIYTRSAVHVDDKPKGVGIYKLDDGQLIEHKVSEGAVVLAKKMLDTIVEV